MVQLNHEVVGERVGVLSKFPFRVVYEVDGYEVIIYRVVHMRRRPHERFRP
ncbi:MAG TPA: hypothetical protein PKD45_03695 [Flavobacteriales bacterium]|nr:hypothetical protein [Flavobacteriales bacterium]